MKLYLQFGYGMLGHSRDLLSEWPESGVILSPRDLTDSQLRAAATDAIERGCEPLLDPQCFSRDSNHVGLTSHDYWKAFRELATRALLRPAGCRPLLNAVARLARSMGVKRHILPGLLADPVNEDWFAFHESVIAEAPRHFGSEPLLATVALSAESLKDEAQVEAVVERARQWRTQGCYIVAETPEAYLVGDPVWLSNLLSLAAGLKLSGKQVFVGYCSHQMLCLACAGVNAIASGTWLNVRAFPPSKFYAPDEDEKSRRTTWYYCPQALSEYKLTFLDLAKNAGILKLLQPIPPSRYAEPLFRAAMPTVAGWREQQAFRHYLTCLRSQVACARQESFDATFDAQSELLVRAQKLLAELTDNGIFGHYRDFSDYVDINRGALIRLRKAYGPRLRRCWA